MHAIVGWSITVFGRWGALGLFLVAFAESSFFPVPPDVLLFPLCLSHPRRALWYATVTTGASVLGAVFAYAVGVRGGRPMLLRFTDRKGLSQTETLFKKYGGWAVGIAAFTPIPFKVFTIASGIFRVRMAPFLIASLIGRGARFFLEAAMTIRFGSRVREVIGPWFEIATLALSLLAVAGAVAAAGLQKRRSSGTAWPTGSRDGNRDGNRDGDAARQARQPRPRPGARLFGRARAALLGHEKRFWGEWMIYAMAGLVFLFIVTEELTELAWSGRVLVLRSIDLVGLRLADALRGLGPEAGRLLRAISALGSHNAIAAMLCMAIALLLLRAKHERAIALTVCVSGALGLSLSGSLDQLMRAADIVGPSALREALLGVGAATALCFYGMAAHIAAKAMASSGRREFQSLIRAIAGIVVAGVTIAQVGLGARLASEAAINLASGGIWLLLCIRLLGLAERGRPHR
ncbi:MAG: YqaA family protein [Clostridia bacterium]|nr:YqaA family protein [Clostridia bacterium]